MLAALKARLKELAGEIDTLSKKEGIEAADMAAHIDAVNKANDEYDALESQIKALERAEAIRAKAAVAADTPIVTTEERTVSAMPERKLTTSEKVGLVAVGMASAWLNEGSKSHRSVMNEIEKAGYGAITKEFPARQRALNAGAATAGGVLIPEAMSSEIIDVLRPQTTFLQGGPRMVTLINGAYKMPAAASSATANWRGEGQAIAKSQPSFREINMTTHFVDALVPLTSQIISWSLPDIRGWVEMDMANVMSVEIDRAGYMGEGTAHTPLGITMIGGVTENAATGGTAPTVAQVEADASAAELSMMQANLPMLGAKWVMNPRTLIFLQNMRDGNGNRYFPELQNANPTWRNKPVLVTTQVSVTGGGTTDESEIWLIAFGHVMMANGSGLTFKVSDEATVVTNGTSVSAFQNDLVYIKCSAEADFDLRFLEAVAKITACRWGA